MTRQTVMKTPTVDGRQLLIPGQGRSTRSGGGSARLAEVAGGTAADCAALCCCCPCGLMNLLLLAMYKLPRGLCRKALQRNRRRRLMKRGLLEPKATECGCDEADFQVYPVPLEVLTPRSPELDQDVLRLEKEMWDRFYGAGFWRSPSQRSE